MAYFDGVANQLVLEMLITGTHSSGKTTVIDGFRDVELEASLGIPESYGFSVQDIQIDGENGPTGLAVPVLSVGEAATKYASSLNDLSVLGENYTFEHQRKIEIEADGALQMARVALVKAVRSLRATNEYDNLANAAVVLADRGPIDGGVYSKLRIPEEDDDTLNGFPLRDSFRAHANASLDCVFIADKSDTPFDQTAGRPADGELRDKIDEYLSAAYSNISYNRPHILHGSPEERRQQIVSTIGFYLDTKFVVRTAITAFEELRRR
jgi:predicted ATPase